MNWNDERRRDALAAEYVLGLLHGRARKRFERRLREDPELERRVWAWRARLEPLLEAPPEAPPQAVWQGIERRLGFSTRRRRAAWWHWLAPVVMSLSILAAIGLGVYVSTRPQYAALPLQVVLHDAARQPVLEVSLRPRQGRVKVRALRALRVPPGRSLELWALPRKGAPVAVGLIRPQPGPPQEYRLRVPAGAVAGFAVSVEPPGGSPKPYPTGPIVYQGRLAPAAGAA